MSGEPKRFKQGDEELITIMDVSTSLDFLYPAEISAHVEGLLSLLLSGRLFNRSFSDLCEEGESQGWRALFVSEQERLPPTEKIKHKRLAANRLIAETTENHEAFAQQVKRIKDQIDDYMSEHNVREQLLAAQITTPKELYDAVQAWRNLQIERRLFPKERGPLCSLFTLQRLMTDRLLDLLDSPIESMDVHHQLMELFDHCWIVVEQPSSSECIAATKYKKSHREYLAKINTRLICLFDPDRIGERIKLSDIKVILYRNDAPHLDPYEDLQWEKQILTNNERIQRRFLYAALIEKKPLRLTKSEEKTRLLDENQLWHLTFSTDITRPDLSFTKSLVIKTQPFGLCSRANYFPDCLSKVFISEMDHLFSDAVAEQAHLNFLEEFMGRVFRRLSGLIADQRTMAFIRRQMRDVYSKWEQTAAANNDPVIKLSFDIYQDLLARLFTQIRFLNLYPFLAMMYHDRLFFGIGDEYVDDRLRGTVPHPELLIRFNEIDKQISTENPLTLFVISNGYIRRARSTQKNFVDEICRCLCKAEETRDPSMWIFNEAGYVPFKALARYYDEQLKQPDVVRTKEGDCFHSLDFLLRDTMQAHPVDQPVPLVQQFDHPVTTFDQYPSDTQTEHSFAITGQIHGHPDSVNEVFDFLKNQFAQYCRVNHRSGVLSLDGFQDFQDGHDW